MPQIKKSNLPEKTCLVCNRPYNGERNGSLFGMKLNIVLKNAEEIDKSKNE